MQVGIDSFAAAYTESSLSVSASERLRDLVAQVEHAEQAGLDVFGIGEHHRREYLDSAPAMILAAASSRTRRIRLTSAVTVLSAADPVRVFQGSYLDLLSEGRAEMVVGRGSSIEAFPLFGYRLEDYDSLFEEKLDLLLKLRDNEHITWSGKHRPALTGQGVYPRPVQNPLPIWRGVGGTPESFVRAGALGLPLMVAIIGGEPRRFRPLIDLYREAGIRTGHSPDQLKVGVHALGYVATTSKEAADDFFPGYARAIASVAKERGWPPVTRAAFDAQLGRTDAVDRRSPRVAKNPRHSEHWVAFPHYVQMVCRPAAGELMQAMGHRCSRGTGTTGVKEEVYMSDTDTSKRDRKLRVLVFSASLGKHSTNAVLAHLAAVQASNYGAIVDEASMREFDAPSFDPDRETSGEIPAGAVEFNRRLAANDAFVIASPEYNGSMPGLIKNAIDWASRFRPQPFHERHGLLLSASPSMAGGNRGLWALRIPLEHLGARIFPDMFSLAVAHKGLAGGTIADATLRKRFEHNVNAFLDLAEAAKNYPCMKKAWVEFLGEPPGMLADRIE